MLCDNFIQALLYREEGESLDFKSAQYSRLGTGKDYEILKDILALANSTSLEDSFILIGVEEVKGSDRSNVVGIKKEEHFEESNLQQFVQGKFSQKIRFSYIPYNFEGKELGIIHIPNQNDLRPFYLKSGYKELKGEAVYKRYGSSTYIAKPEDIALMGKAIKPDTKPRLELVAVIGSQESAKLKITKVLTRVVGEISFEKSFNSSNENYWTDVIAYTEKHLNSTAITFKIKNESEFHASDIFIKVELDYNTCEFDFLEKLPAEPKLNKHALDIVAESLGPFPDQQRYERNLKNKVLEFEEKSLQPYREIELETYYIKPIEFGLIRLKVSIHSKELPAPLEQEIEILVSGEFREITAEELKEIWLT